MTQITADDDGDSDDDDDDDNVDGDNHPNHLTTNRGSSSHRGSSEVRTGSANQLLQTLNLEIKLNTKHFQNNITLNIEFAIQTQCQTFLKHYQNPNHFKH